MAHYAKLDDTNTVIDVLVVDDAQEAENGVAWIQQWLKDSFGGTKWLKTSYNTIGGKHLAAGTPFRMNYAVIGGEYDANRDAFLAKQPYPSWTLNESTCLWEAPMPDPTVNTGIPPYYKWDEAKYTNGDGTETGWVEIED
jgi:hypothetical protein|tara:strand:- start:590 stop:1009 length:420 start_codon:yes stop_codon:yes gene_type:complete